MSDDGIMFTVDDDGVVSSVDEENLIYVDKNELEQFIESYQELEEENKIFREFIELNDFDADEIIRQGKGLE